MPSAKRMRSIAASASSRVRASALILTTVPAAQARAVDGLVAHVDQSHQGGAVAAHDAIAAGVRHPVLAARPDVALDDDHAAAHRGVYRSLSRCTSTRNERV